MADPEERELTLYVQSQKVVANFYRPGPSSAAGVAPESGLPTGPGLTARSDPEAGMLAGEEFFLSDDQARCVALAEELAEKRGYKVKVVDVARVGRIERLITERLRGVDKFPVLIGAGSSRLVGPEAFTEEHLSEMMPAEMRGTRAFTYLKVRGSDLERIRGLLLSFPQVRELHLLTGDWDVFLVLEFTGGANKKREVFDFVSQRIREIPEVLDTSTLIPEYSTSKFPF
ncbi:MAG: Lrp/AsnC ligand binding domain-containing protein [Thermoplasmata archaeon]|nr:Lrp/AsnC ligand binding domain-containing protein [Thermoplasmata archaeon]